MTPEEWDALAGEYVLGTLEAGEAGAVERALAAGATLEREATTHAYGHIALLADPWGNGFCLLEFVGGGYDEITLKHPGRAPA
jgi:hypothetical protein